MRYISLCILSIFLFCFCVSFGSGGMLEGEGKHEFYLLDKSSSARIVSLDETKARSFIYLKRDLKGESIELFDQKKVELLLSSYHAEKVYTEKGNNFYCDYFYSPFIPDFVFINGHKVNLQLSYGKERTVVGCPIIFGSF